MARTLRRHLPSGLCRGASSLVVACAIALAAALPTPTPAQPLGNAPPSFAELEAAQARIGEVRVRTEDVFDTGNPKEDWALYRWANALHIQTRAGVIENALLFKRGDPVSVAVIEETERLLRDQRYLYDVQIRPVAFQDGVVDIEVVTRDSWSLIPGVSAARAGGENSSGIRLREYNFLGTGTTLGVSHSSNVDRSSNQLLVANDRVFGSRTAAGLSLARNSDGERYAASVVRPFYSLDATWAAGAAAVKDNRIDPIYNAGNVVSEYRHRQDQAEVFAGWSRGRIDGWVQRYSVGVSLLDNEFANEPGRVAPAVLNADERLIGPFIRYELIEDRYVKVVNRDMIGVPEFFALGLASTVQLGWASTALGSSHDALLYQGSVSRGFVPSAEQTLLASASIAGQYTDGRVRKQLLGVDAKYYLPQGKRWLFYAAASGDMLTHPDVLDMLLLGGDNGLRGYPLRYQAGDKRALLTLEERLYANAFVWNLFRVGAAAFVDVGRAWGGPHVNTANPGWLADAGIGLRISSVRVSTKDVLHIDLAFPLNATDDIKKVQVLVKGKTSF
jgi:hemolysin activation/secretion protein